MNKILNSNLKKSGLMRFLVVDDQDFARAMMRQVVSNNPLWSVVGEAENGLEAVAMMDREPRVVLMDIVMPVMDGLEATREIKRIAPDVVIILTTAYQNSEFRTRGLKAGADGFVQKDNLTTKALQKILRAGERGRNEQGRDDHHE